MSCLNAPCAFSPKESSPPLSSPSPSPRRPTGCLKKRIERPEESVLWSMNSGPALSAVLDIEDYERILGDLEELSQFVRTTLSPGERPKAPPFVAIRAGSHRALRARRRYPRRWPPTCPCRLRRRRRDEPRSENRPEAIQRASGTVSAQVTFEPFPSRATASSKRTSEVSARASSMPLATLEEASSGAWTTAKRSSDGGAE